MNDKKNYMCFLCLVLIILSISGCTNINTDTVNFNASKYVSIPDYKNIEIEKEYTEITQNELETIIAADMSYNSIFKEVENRKQILEDDILLLNVECKNPGYQLEQEYYTVGDGSFGIMFDETLLGMSLGENKRFKINSEDNVETELTVTVLGIYRDITINDEDILLPFYKQNSMSEVENYIRDRTAQEIVYNYMYDYISQNAEFSDKYPKYIENRINEDIKDLEQKALNNNQTIEEYLESMDTTYDDYIANMHSYYQDFILDKAILERENIEIQESDVENFLKKLSDIYSNDYRETNEYYTYNDAYYQLMTEKIKTVLPKYVHII